MSPQKNQPDKRAKNKKSKLNEPPPDPALEMMAYLDGELSPKKAKEFELKLDSHPEWREELQHLAEINSMTDSLSYKPLREDFWDGYWEEIEPGISTKKNFTWYVMLAGFIIVLLYVYLFIITLFDSLFWQAGTSMILFGGTFLYILVLRAQKMDRSRDRYRKVRK